MDRRDILWLSVSMPSVCCEDARRGGEEDLDGGMMDILDDRLQNNIRESEGVPINNRHRERILVMQQNILP